MKEEKKPYEQRDGTFAMWQKVNQEGESYLSGKLFLDGKYYWINLYKNKYHSGMPGDNKPISNGNVKPVDQQ